MNTENFIIIILIILLISFILNIVIAIKYVQAIIKLHDIKAIVNKDDKKKEPKTVDELIHSLGFNTYLDKEIRVMLGNYKNEDIIIKASTLMMEYYTDILTQNDYVKIQKYIREVLLNYNNPYTDRKKEDNSGWVEELPDVAVEKGIIEKQNPNSVNISNTLNNFYN